jgi:biopolymer transport protein ExbB
MSFDLVEIWKHMNPLARGIAGFLLLMMIASIGVVVERSIAFARSRRATQRFAREAGPLIKEWKASRVLDVCLKHSASPLATLFAAMMKKYVDALDRNGSLSPVELARNEAERQMEQIGAELRRGMSVLASVGSVAPFVGLLGTVVGIIGAFKGIGASGSAGLGSVMTGISEALIETAFGLLVAIPAVLFYNYLTARVSRTELDLGSSMGELLDEMENNHESDNVSRRQISRAA